MNRTSTVLAGIVAALAAGWLALTAAEAQNDKSFVSSVGDDANDCATIATACRNFQRAHDVTNPQGQIACVDSLDAGGAFIFKSITVDCAGTSATTLNFIVNAPGAVVVIRNLTLFTEAGVSGIDFRNGATLIVEDCVIRDNLNFGIWFRPPGAGRLIVTNTVLANNGNGTSGAGLLVQPTGGSTDAGTDVVLDRVRVENNSTGVFIDASAGTKGVSVTMRESTVASNTFTGFFARTAGPTITTMIETSANTNSGGVGLMAQGPQAFVFVNRSTITGNDTGWTVAGGGNVVTYGTNSVHLNRTSNGAPSASIGLQ